RPGWQRFVIAVGCVAVAVTAVVVLVLKLTAGLTTAADGFVAAMKAHDLGRAKSYLAEDFRASATDPEVSQFIERSALARYAGSSWSRRSVTNNRGTLEGTALTDSGGAIPLVISFIRERGEWKIYSIGKPEAGLASESKQSMPSAADQVR